MSKFKQHDATDCGVACLAYVFQRHGLQTSLSALRQKAGTCRSGTTALGLVDTAKLCGFEAKGVRCKFDDLRFIALPGIAHVLLEGGRQHYVVVCGLNRKRMLVMDPRVGRVQSWSFHQFKAGWTNVFIVLSPSTDFSPSRKSVSAWARLISLLGPQKAILAQAFVGVILTTILSLAGAVYIQKIVDNVIVDGNRNLLRLLGVGMLGILGLRVLIGYFQSLLMLRSAQKIDAGLLLGYYRHLMRLPQSFFDTMRVGEITSRMRDAVAVRDFLNGTILGLMLNPIILTVAVAAMFAYSWKLAVFSLALVPAYIVIYFASDWLNRRYQREIMERSADLDAQIVESLHSMSVVRSCGIEDAMSFRTETRVVRVLKRVWSAANAGLVVGGAGSFVTQAYSIGLLWIGAELVLNSQLTAGELMSCNAIAGYITGPIVAIIGMNASIRSATTATERLYEILDLEREKDEGTAELHLETHFDLVIEKLNFRYPGRLATLKDVTLRFQSGMITSLVGKSGCGKSTLLAILQRHYLPDSGKIFVGGVELQYLQLRSLRSHIAFVPQKIDMLAGTVLENIAPNESQPDMMRITELCRTVGILEFVESLPRGFQTLITENGANLSGGQKQRLAIVRALYSDARIVLMDEPSSALDNESEAMLVDALQRMRDHGKLVILAVHNRKLLAICDQIIEMGEGRVVRITTAAATTGESTECAANHADVSRRTEGGLADESATAETNALFFRLRDAMDGRTLFGQTDANVMGVDRSGKGWFLEEDRCDIHSVTAKWPAIYGFDIGTLKNGWMAGCGYLVPKIRDAHARGGVVTVVWHPENLVSGDSSMAGCAVAEILPGTAYHKHLCDRLDLIADNLGNLRDRDGHSIPIIFRCWHQQNREQYWWGRSRCTPEEYIRLYRFTVTYLRDVRMVHNFLYGFSVSRTGEPMREAFHRYPGDEYVDVLGLDWFGSPNAGSAHGLQKDVADLVEIAAQRRKIAGLTQVGFSAGPDRVGLGHCENPEWLKEGFFEPMRRSVGNRLPSFVVFWRNEAANPSVYQLPPPGSIHAECLVRLAADRSLVFTETGTSPVPAVAVELSVG